MIYEGITLPRVGNLDDPKEKKRIVNALYEIDEKLRLVLNNLDLDNFGGELGDQLKALEVNVDKLNNAVADIDISAIAASIGQTIAEINASIESMSSTIERTSSQITTTVQQVTNIQVVVNGEATNLIDTGLYHETSAEYVVLGQNVAAATDQRTHLPAGSYIYIVSSTVPVKLGYKQKSTGISQFVTEEYAKESSYEFTIGADDDFAFWVYRAAADGGITAAQLNSWAVYDLNEFSLQQRIDLVQRNATETKQTAQDYTITIFQQLQDINGELEIISNIVTAFKFGIDGLEISSSADADVKTLYASDGMHIRDTQDNDLAKFTVNGAVINNVTTEAVSIGKSDYGYFEIVVDGNGFTIRRRA